MTIEKTVLAGGCFWGMEELFRQLKGVVDTQVGYTGGTFENPTYPDMRTGKTGHAESIEIAYDTDVTTFQRVLEFFFQIHDPTTPDRQGNDRGSQYRSAIFYKDDAQKQVAEEVIAAVNASGKWPGKVATQLVPATTFYLAEHYHQDYLQKNPGGYTCHWVRPDWVLEKKDGKLYV
jgi:peptide-methionine (S)-S-oxide reductase